MHHRRSLTGPAAAMTPLVVVWPLTTVVAHVQGRLNSLLCFGVAVLGRTPVGVHVVHDRSPCGDKTTESKIREQRRSSRVAGLASAESILEGARGVRGSTSRLCSGSGRHDNPTAGCRPKRACRGKQEWG